MKARIKVESFATSIWGGMAPMDHRENVYVMAEGESISTDGLGRTYRLQIAAIRPRSVDILVRPDLMLQSSEQDRTVGPLTLDVGDTAQLQTLSRDAWGNWLVSLERVVS